MAKKILIGLNPPEPEAIPLGSKGVQLDAHTRR
jgi:hypothetical protein